MALNEYQQGLLDELVEFVESWKSDDPEYNGLIRDKYLIEFVSDLQTKIYNEISMSGKNGQTLLLYTGQSTETGEWIWQRMEDFCANNPDYYYITNTDAGSILWEEDFQDAVIKAIKDEDISTQILSGKYWDSELNKAGVRKGPYAIDGTTLLALDDFISSTLTQKAIENGNRVIYVAGQGWNSDSVGMQSEIPTFIKEAWIGKNIDEALNTRLTIVSDLSEITDIDSQHISDVDLYKTEFYVDADGKVTGVKLVSDLDDINVGTVSTDGTMLTYGSRLGILGDEAIIGKYNLLEEFTQTDIDMYRRFDYYTSVGVSDKGIRKIGILSDVDIKFKYEFLSDCTDTDVLNYFRNYEYITTNEIAKTTADKMSATNIYLNSEGKIVSMSDMSTGEIPAESVYKITMNDAKNFLSNEKMESTYRDYKNLSAIEKIQAKQFDYEKRLISDMVDRGIKSENGIDLLPTDELKTKYSFIDDATDANVIKELQLAEYQNRKYGINTAENMKIYFDETGSVTAVTNQKYATVDTGNIEKDAKFSTTVDDYLKFADDADMETQYKDYALLDKIDKIQAKQLDLELRVVSSQLGEINVSAATVERYIAASGKPLSQLDVVDKILIKAADGITGGNNKIIKTIGNFTDKCKGISSVAKKAMPVANFVMTVYEIGTTLSVAGQYYDSGDYGRAAKVVTDFVSVEAGGWAASTVIGTYAMGFGAAVGGPIGAVAGALVSGVVGYTAAGVVVDVASDIGYSFGGWLYDVFHDASDAEVRKSIDPLILDIDGDGFNIGARKKGVNFDLNCDGFAEKINWTSKDGLLSYDIDGNGKIDNGREVFGDYHLLADGTRAKNGFEALIQYDTNGDGIIDKNDEIFSKLCLWIDTSSDGISDSGELKTLEELNIVAIKLNYEEVNRTTGTEALIGNVATFVYADNTEGEIGEMWVSSDLYDTVETFMADVSESVEGLPNVRSYGTVSSLHNAMALDETGELQSLVESFVSEEDMSTRMGIVEDILWFICDANSVSQYSRGSFIDARKLKVIESFMGQDFIGVNGAVFGNRNYDGCKVA